MPPADRIYLDNAATSWPKPEAVYEAVDDYQRRLGASVGRSAYAEALEADAIVRRTRHAVAEWISAPSDDSVVFTSNGTDSLNFAIHGLVRPGDHVVTTDAEHNSVLRPLSHLADAGIVTYTRVGCDESGTVDASEIRAAIEPATRLVVVTHASNVTGAVQPIEQIIRAAHDAGALVLIDAAQTLGSLPLNVQSLDVDLLAAPGHKGLLGPLGTGVLYIRPGLSDEVSPLRQGGTGSHSEQDRQPGGMPDRFESGNHNGPAIAGLGAALRFLGERGIDAVAEHHRDLTARLLDGLAAIDAVRVYGPRADAPRVGVVSITVDGYDPQEFAALLDQAFRVQVRAGLHCAPAMHRALGTAPAGTIRFSIGVFTTAADVDTAVDAVRQLAATAVNEGSAQAVPRGTSIG